MILTRFKMINKIPERSEENMSTKKSFRNFKKPEKHLTTEQKIESFVIRNSRNGYFTKVKTIPFKFEISEDKAWDIVGELLGNGKVEATHDEFTGEMKLCETGKTYSIMNLEQERKRKPNRQKKNYSKTKKK